LSEQERLKRQAAERAVEFVESGMVLGLGTGSTARHILEIIVERLREGALRDLVGVPTSRATERHALELGFPLVTLDEEPRIDLTLDGADEVDPNLRLIKGLGGALLWEKIVASASERVVIVVDESKLVDELGERAPLPVEVVPFGWTTHLGFLDLLGARATLRRNAVGDPLVTDGGHFLLDCRFESAILEPERIERELRQRVGVVETGLFIDLADTVVVGGVDGVRLLGGEE
jgi:ribose 5-phosphate isomerase A